MGRRPVGLIGHELEEPIWEQQQGENRKLYTMFIQFANLKPTDRMTPTSWKLYTEGSSKEGKPVTQYYRLLAHVFRWKERAAARDFHLATSQQSKWLERDQERRDNDFELGTKLIQQADRILEVLKGGPALGTLTEAKDAAVAGATLRERAVPSLQFAADQIGWLLNVLPPEKRTDVLKQVAQLKRLPAPREDVVEGEVRVLNE